MTATPSRLIETPVPAGPAAAGDPFKIVSNVLDLVRLNGSLFFRWDFGAPWSYRSPALPELTKSLPEGTGSLVMFHIVTEGHCWIALDDGVRHELVPGDVVVTPYADEQTWGSYEPSDPVNIATLLPPRPWVELPHLRYGGAGEETRMVCGYLRGDAILFDPVLRALPPMFVVHPPAGPAASWLSATVEYAMSGHAPGVDGSRPDQRMVESLFSEMLRLYLQDRADVALTGWLAALRDPLVGPAMELLHADPARPWTVAELARAVAVSRTVLVDGFVRLLGRPPIRYLTEWRLNLASGLLRTTDAGVGEIAMKVGYTSEEAFSRAFKRAFGRAPAHWRAERG
jgi:AraC-like DNA-binding protein